MMSNLFFILFSVFLQFPIPLKREKRNNYCENKAVDFILSLTWRLFPTKKTEEFNGSTSQINKQSLEPIYSYDIKRLILIRIYCRTSVEKTARKIQNQDGQRFGIWCIWCGILLKSLQRVSNNESPKAEESESAVMKFISRTLENDIFDPEKSLMHVVTARADFWSKNYDDSKKDFMRYDQSIMAKKLLMSWAWFKLWQMPRKTLQTTY